MKIIRNFFGKLISIISIYYIEFVYKTSKLKITGPYDLLKTECDEKFIATFWHGCSYAVYPFLKGEKLYVITTLNTRGNYVSLICKHFGYDTIRVPDESEGGNFLFKIRREINGKEKGNLAIALDGPMGPYHEPKEFPFVAALLTKRKVIGVSFKCKRKIIVKNRWDKYLIPLPFNTIEIHVNDPMEVNRQHMKENFIIEKEEIKKLMKE